MHDRTLMHTLCCMFTLTLNLSTGRSLTLTALMITLGARRLGCLAAAVVDGGTNSVPRVWAGLCSLGLGPIPQIQH